MPKKLTQEQIAGYERDGYVCPVDAFSAERARTWRGRMEAFERAQGQKMTRGHNFKPHLLFPWVDEIVHAPEVLDAVEDLIGPDIRLFHLTVWPKDAGSGTYVSWHQDATYFALEPACHVTAWVARPKHRSRRLMEASRPQTSSASCACPMQTRRTLSRGQTLAVTSIATHSFMPVKAASSRCTTPTGAQFAANHSRPPQRSRHQLHPDSARCTAGLASPPCWCAARRIRNFDDERRPVEEVGPADARSRRGRGALRRGSREAQENRLPSVNARQQLLLPPVIRGMVGRGRATVVPCASSVMTSSEFVCLRLSPHVASPVHGGGI